MFHFKKNNVYLQPETQKEPRWIQTFFVPRRGALCLPNPRPLPEEGEMVAELRMNL